MTFQVWIDTARKLGASDLHLETGTPVLMRVRDELMKIGESVTDSEIARIPKELVEDAAWARSAADRKADRR